MSVPGYVNNQHDRGTLRSRQIRRRAPPRDARAVEQPDGTLDQKALPALPKGAGTQARRWHCPGIEVD